MIAFVFKDWGQLDLSVSYNDLMKRGPALLLDHWMENGSRVVLWTSVRRDVSTNKDVLPDYFGLAAPGAEPERFSPWIFRELGGKAPTNPEFSPDFKHFFFSLVDTSQDGSYRQTIMHSKRMGNGWGKPQEAGFLKNDDYNMGEPFFSRDGKFLYFQSNRPPGKPIWNVKVFCSRVLEEGFSKPEYVPVADQDHGVFFPFPAKDGSLYFCSDLPDRIGRTDLYRAELDDRGHYSIVSNLGSLLNTEHIEWDPYLDPDEEMMLFVSGRPGGFGEVDIYLSRLTDEGHWGEPKNLGEPINSSLYDTAAKLSPEGRFLFFQRIIDEKEVLYWVDFEKYLVKHGL